MSQQYTMIEANLTRDPEIRHVAGRRVAKLGVALNEGTKENEITTFVRIDIWENSSYWTFILNDLEVAKKGDSVMFSGLVYRRDEWEGENGELRVTHYFKNGFGASGKVFLRRDEAQPDSPYGQTNYRAEDNDDVQDDGDDEPLPF